MSKLFLIDDHPMVREGLRAVLTGNDHTVVGESDSSSDAPELLRRSGAEVLVLDIHIKPMSGLDVLRKIQADALSVRTVVLTMSSQPLHVTQAIGFGALAYVLKGSPASELFHAIACVLQGQIFLGENVPRPAESAGDPLLTLSVRERQILELVVRGNTSAAIGTALDLSPKTVETYRSRLMTKLELPNLASLVLFAVESGILGESQVIDS